MEDYKVIRFFAFGVIFSIIIGLFTGYNSDYNSHLGRYVFFGLLCFVILVSIIWFVVLQIKEGERESVAKQHAEEMNRLMDDIDRKIEIKNKEANIRIQAIVDTIGGADIDIYYSDNNAKRFVVNETNKVVLIEGNVYDFSDILSFEIKDNSSTCTNYFSSPQIAKTYTDSGNLLGRAIAGNIVGGKMGAVIGASTASKTTIISGRKTISTTQTNHFYRIIITINKLKNPIISLEIGDDSDITERIAGILSVIIHHNKS